MDTIADRNGLETRAEARNKLIVLCIICSIAMLLRVTLCVQALWGRGSGTVIHDVLLVVIGTLGGLLVDVSVPKQPGTPGQPLQAEVINQPEHPVPTTPVTGQSAAAGRDQPDSDAQ